MSLNAQLDTDASWEYILSSNKASNYYQYQGTHNWRVAGAGTAGSAAGRDGADARKQAATLPPDVRSAGGAQPAADSLSLRVSSPEVLLNHMAERYSSSSRIVMEFIDNAFDSAEGLLEERRSLGSEGEDVSAVPHYSRPIDIDVVVDRERRTIRVTDNCVGMPRDVLRRVVLNVGESRKRGSSFLNGQFGFGMQAFRACCGSLVVRSRADPGAPVLGIAISRGQADGFELEEVVGSAADAAVGATGTDVLLSDFDEQWVDSTFEVDAMAAEIESHFERLLGRGNLRVRVRCAATGEERACRPFDYADPALDAAAHVERVFTVATPGASADAVPQTVRLSLAVVRTEVNDRQPRFFVNGRRVSAVCATRSFTGVSAKRWTVWAHPLLVGYIDVDSPPGAPLQPVITRDEFKRTRGRRAAFQRVVDECEAELEAALEGINKAQSDKDLTALEDLLTQCLSSVSKEDNRRRRKKRTSMWERAKRAVGLGNDDADVQGIEPPEGGLAALWAGVLPTVLTVGAPAAEDDVETGDDTKAEANTADVKNMQGGGAAKKSNEFAPEVRLVASLPGEPSGEQASSDTGGRSRLAGNCIYVAVSHPDFQERLRKSRRGREKIDERLLGYLSTLIAAHYRERELLSGRLEDDTNPFANMVDTYVNLEGRLRTCLPALLRQIEEAEAEVDA